MKGLLVSPEPNNDPLDKALTLRRAAAPPYEFTSAVLAHIKANERRRFPEELVIEYGVGVGLALAAFGVSLVLDVRGAMAAATEALRSPEAASIVAVFAICFAWVQIRKEPETEAL